MHQLVSVRAQYPKNMFTTYYIVLLSVNQKTSKHVKDDYTKSSVKTYILKITDTHFCFLYRKNVRNKVGKI